jgi:chitodextrinase
MHDVRSGDYTFTADSADNWNRFVLHFTPPTQISSIDATCSTAGTITIQQPGSANWNYTITDNNNAIVTNGVLNQSQPVTLSVAPGTYILTMVDANNYTAVKSIVVNGPGVASAGFSVSQSVVQTQQAITLTADNSSNSTYQWNFGNGVTTTGPVAIISYAQPGVYNVSLFVTNQSGCSATQTHSISVNTTTGLTNANADNMNIWSHDNNVYVDFSAQNKVDAQVIIYNVLGQTISSERVTNNLLYHFQINDVEAAYFIVMVKQGDSITTRKVFISNIK